MHLNWAPPLNKFGSTAGGCQECNWWGLTSDSLNTNTLQGFWWFNSISRKNSWALGSSLALCEEQERWTRRLTCNAHWQKPLVFIWTYILLHFPLLSLRTTQHQPQSPCAETVELVFKCLTLVDAQMGNEHVPVFTEDNIGKPHYAAWTN